MNSKCKFEYSQQKNIKKNHREFNKVYFIVTIINHFLLLYCIFILFSLHGIRARILNQDILIMASTSNTFQVPLPKLSNGDEYNDWAVHMKVFFRAQDLWDVVENGFVEVKDSTEFESLTKEEKDALIEKRKKDQKALCFIFSSVEQKTIFQKISLAETSYAAWDILQKSYKGDDRVRHVRLQTLRGQFENLNMNEDETVGAYFDRVQYIVNQLRANGEVVSDQRVVEKITRSTNSEFDNVVPAIEEGNDMSQMTLEKLHEQRKKYRNNNNLSNPEHALQTRAHITTRGG